MSFRDHLVETAERGHTPVFRSSKAEPLRVLDQIFAATDLYSLDVNKHQPVDELSPYCLMTAERLQTAHSSPEIFTCEWTPVAPGVDPRTGFRIGPDSILFGSTAAATMPNDERTAALLLLVTSDFVHLSASREQNPALIRGAIDGHGEGFDYVVLDRT